MQKAKASPEKIAQEWLEVHEELSQLKARKETLELFLKPYLKAQPDETVEVAGYRLKLVQSAREAFSLSKARAKLSKTVLTKLEEFISHSKSSYIKSTFLGDVAQAEAA